MKVKTAYSTKDTLHQAIADLAVQTKECPAKMVIYFASPKFDPQSVAAQMKSLYADSDVFGCTTAGEIVSGMMLKGSIVVMLLGSELVEDVKIEVVRDIDQACKVSQAFDNFATYYGSDMADLDFEKYVGIILVDGLRGAEEKLMDRIGDLTNITFVGASAGDDLQFKQTHVFADGQAHTNAAVLALIKCAGTFDFIKTQSFLPLDKYLVASRVEQSTRKVLEFDHKPAVIAYSEALGITAADAPKKFMHHPIGLMVDSEPYVRSPQQVQDQAMIFYCNIKEGMKLQVLSSTDIVADTGNAVKLKVQELGGISAIINFHCILRTLELESNDQTSAYGKLFANIPTVGFSTYGEEYIGHINQTSTMLVFH